MTQKKTPIEVTSFSRGLITEVNPLNFPPEASIDEQNFIVNRDGTRSRRLGMDFEPNHVLNSTGIGFDNAASRDVDIYEWENVAENPDLTCGVLWVGNKLFFTDLTKDALSETQLAPPLVLNKFNENNPLSMADVDGRLIVVSGADEVALVSYKDGVMSVTYNRLLIRDFFGVEDLYTNIDTDGETIDLREGNNTQFRPRFKTDTHVYNLRNQTWGGVKRSHLESHQSYDPIENFHTAAYYEDDKYEDIKPVDGIQKGLAGDKGVLPSNADISHYAMAPDAEDDPPTDNFYARTLFDVPLGNSEAPRGYFIIDALRRGTSRLEAYQAMMERNPKNHTLNNKYGLTVDIETLPADITPNGAKVVEEYAGRVWYGGFSGDIIDGDSYSPKMSSYLLFSKLVENSSDINKCYQDGDPTSEETPDILDTDGGYIRISGAYNIRKLINIGSGLVVLAQNGVWVILGQTEDAGFTATGFQIVKVSDYSILSTKSAVEVDNSLIYWSEDGIYTLSSDKLKGFSVQNITQSTIQSFYDGISVQDKSKVKGIFDQFERKVRWLYGDNKELVLDLNLQAFTKNSIDDSVKIRSLVKTPSYSIGTNTESVTVDGVPVTVSGEPVEVTYNIRSNGFRSIKYLTITDVENEAMYSFSSYNNGSFLDWYKLDGVGVDAEAYMITGYLNGGDNQRGKQVPYLTVHSVKTEDGFDGEFELRNQSSCLVTAQWSWSNSPNSNNWGREFQAYRLGRVYMSGDTTFDDGRTVVSTKNKIRGSGRVVSFMFKTEPQKNCELLGWSILVGVKGNV